jgi:hypothetical protein
MDLADRTRPGWCDRHLCAARRGPGGPRRLGRRHSLHAIDRLDLLDRGSRPRRQGRALVAALRPEGPWIHAQRARARLGRRHEDFGVHRRPAGAGLALSRRAFGHGRTGHVAAPADPGCHAPPLGARRRPPRPPTLVRQHCRLHRAQHVDGRIRGIHRRQFSIRRSAGRISNGSATPGRASCCSRA